MSHQSRQVDKMHLSDALRNDRNDRYSNEAKSRAWAILKITKLPSGSPDELYRAQRQKFDRTNQVVNHTVTDEVIVGSPMGLPLAIGSIVLARYDNCNEDGDGIYNAWLANPGIPMNPKILHPSAFDLETIDTVTEVEWDYEKWSRHDANMYPEYFNNGVEYDGYEVFEIVRGPLYKPYGDRKIYTIYCRALYTPDGRRMKRWDYKRYEITTMECQ